MQKTIAQRVAQGQGREAADLVIRDVRLFELVTGDLGQIGRAMGRERV